MCENAICLLARVQRHTHQSTREELSHGPSSTTTPNGLRLRDRASECLAIGMTDVANLAMHRRSFPRTRVESGNPITSSLGSRRQGVLGPNGQGTLNVRVVVIGPNSKVIDDVPQSKDRGSPSLRDSLAVLSMRLLSLGLGLAIGVLVLWTREALDSVGGVSAALKAGGRIIGIFAGCLLLMQVLSMSRLRWLNQRVGMAELHVVHREIGSLLTVAVLLHVSLGVEGSALANHVAPIEQLRTILALPNMVSASIGTLVLLSVGVLAIRIVRTTMPHEVWHALHMTSYAVLVLTYAHQFTAGSEISHLGLARAVWVGCYVFVVAVWLWGRVLTPIRVNLRHRLRVTKVVAEGPRAFSIHLTGRLLDEMQVRAGHSLHWRFLTGPYWWQSHPFSLSAAPTKQCLRLTINVAGRYTEQLRRVRPGTRLLCSDPFGVSTADRRTRRRSVVIGAGSGIAPARALLEELPPGTSFIYRARSVDDLIFRNELQRLANEREAQIFVIVGSRYDPGPASALTTGGIRWMVPDVGRRDVFVCGPPGLVDDVAATLAQLKLPRRQLHLLHFRF